MRYFLEYLFWSCFGDFGDALALALGGFAIGDDLVILEETCYMLEILFMLP